MAEAADRKAWDRAASIWAAVVNMWRSTPVSPAVVHPYHADVSSSGGVQLTTDNLDVFCEAVVSQHAKRC